MEKISGMHIYYYYVCKRKLWYYIHELSMESDNEDVKTGKMIDESTYKRSNKHIMIDNTINIDYISEHKLLHEVKKSKKVEEASIWQLKYYLFYLKKRGVNSLKGRLDYPLLKSCVEIELSLDDEKEIENTIVEIKKISELALPPRFEKKTICKACAYYALCCI